MEKDKTEKIEQPKEAEKKPETAPAGQTEAQKAEEKAEEEFLVNVETMVNNTGKEIDYEKLIKQFGCYKIDEKMLERFETLTGRKPHTFLRRGKTNRQRFLLNFLEKLKN